MGWAKITIQQLPPAGEGGGVSGRLLYSRFSVGNATMGETVMQH